MCAFLLHLLNKNRKTKFVISDEHSNISVCSLPEWLPGEVVHLMVMEFSHRLREELNKLQESNNLQGRAGTSDMGRMSMDSIRSVEHREFEIVDDVVEVFACAACSSS